MLDKKLMGERIKELRNKAEKTGTNVSTIIGMDQSYYSKIEKGMHVLKLETLIQIAELYNVSLDYLTGRTNKKEINR